MFKRLLYLLAATLVLSAVKTLPACAQLAELDGYTMTVGSTAATSLETDKWYVLYNCGRSSYAYENSSDNNKLYGTLTAPGSGVDAYDAANCKYLIRFVASGTEGQVYIQTGFGHYYGKLTQSDNKGDNEGTTESAEQAYIYGLISDATDHFWFQAQGSYTLNMNETTANSDATVAGWRTSTTTLTTSNANANWQLFPVTLKRTSLGAGAYRLRSNRDATLLLTNDNAGGSLYARAKTSDAPRTQIWLVERSGSGYTFRSLATGQYIQKQTQTETVLTTGLEPVVFYAEVNDDGDKVAVSYNSDFSGNSCFHDAGNHRVVVWNTNPDASWWTIEPVTDWTTEEIKASLNDTVLSAEQTPATETYYRIYNHRYGTAMLETNGKMTCSAADEDNYHQLWQLEGSGDTWALKNVLTGNYISNSGSRSAQYTTTSTSSTFTLADAGNAWEYLFYIEGPSNSLVLHCDASSNVVGWYTGADASKWRLTKVELTDDQLTEIKAQQAVISDYNTLTANLSTYNTTLQKYFTTTACTTLNDTYASMSEENLTAAMEEDGLPDVLQNIVLKVRDADGTKWTTYVDGWDKTEKTFRIGTYSAYSAGGSYGSLSWTSVMGHDYCYGRVTNPTGIVATSGDLLEVFVGSETDSTLYLEIVPEGSAVGTQYQLAQGLNVIMAGTTGNCFVDYNVTNIKKAISGSTYDDDTSTLFTKLSTYPDVTVHIEGGKVNGYFDLTKDDDNTDWGYLRDNLLTSYSACVLKTKKLIFNLNTDFFLNTCGASSSGDCDVTQLLTDWDNLVTWEDTLEGVGEYEKPGYFNCMLTATTITSNYMYASSYGTYYNRSSSDMGGVFNSTKFHQSGGTIWGPAHENGHIRQGLINSAGLTEVSNNLFSAMAVFKQGYFTSRGAPVTTTFSNMASGVFWLDRDGWESMRLYYQLYLFFHVQGIDTSFYQHLFRALRKDRLNKSHTTFVDITEDYLKFYEKACEVSGYDLTEFFQAYGFFEEPTNLQTITLDGKSKDNVRVEDDYYKTYLVYSDDLVAKSKDRVKAMNLKEANPIFIEDRVKTSAATYEGATEGTVKSTFTSDADHLIGTHGNTGQYSDFSTTATVSGYSYHYDDEGNIIITSSSKSGGNAVGFKVYDASGNLVYLANDSTGFTIPADIWSAIQGTAFSVVAAGATSSQTMTATKLTTIYMDVYDPDDEAGGYKLRVSAGGYLPGDATYGTITAWPSALDGYPYTSYYYKDGDTEVTTPNITVTDNMVTDKGKYLKVYYKFSAPFKPSYTDNVHYYYVKISSGETLAYVDYSTQNDYGNIISPVAPDATANSQWAFWGDPFNGFAITNRKLGDDTYFTYTAASNGGGLKTTEDKYLWQIDKITDETFSISITGTSLFWNRYSGAKGTSMRFWSDTSDNEPVSVEAADEPDTYSGYYRIKNYYTNSGTFTHYLTLNVSGASLTAAGTATTSPTTIFHLKEQADGRVVISSHGQYLKEYDSGISTSTSASDAYQLHILKGAYDGTRRLTAFGLPTGDSEGNGHYYHHNGQTDGSGTTVNVWGPAAQTAHWIIEPVTAFDVSLNATTGASYATAYLPFAYTLPEGTTANAVSVSGTTAELAEFSEVPEGTGVVLVNSSAASSVTLTVGEATADESTTASSNQLEGSYVNATQDADATVFALSGGSSGNEPGFYVYAGQLGAYKAYLPADVTSGSVRALLLDGSALTGVSSAPAASSADAAATYDLQGRRVSQAQRGLYIRGGKKVLVR